MHPYADATEARIDRQAEQAQEAYDALYSATLAKWAAAVLRGKMWCDSPSVRAVRQGGPLCGARKRVRMRAGPWLRRRAACVREQCVRALCACML